jgi:hypothetical protein
MPLSLGWPAPDLEAAGYIAGGRRIDAAGVGLGWGL